MHEETPIRFSDEFFSFIWETVKIVVLSLAIIVPIRYYLVQPFFVKGSSMVPNFHDKDYILVDKLSYRFDDFKRGDVIVFRYPKDPKDYFIKRVIGLPGETIQVKGNKVTIYNTDNPAGEILEEAYLADYQRTDGNKVWKLDDNEFFVLGDNRLQSSDSRSWDALNRSFIAGRAWIRLWPFDVITKIPRVTYPDAGN
ncbi:MAG: signal peptidase I [Patescibacteria group bacterium]